MMDEGRRREWRGRQGLNYGHMISSLVESSSSGTSRQDVHLISLCSNRRVGIPTFDWLLGIANHSGGRIRKPIVHFSKFNSCQYVRNYSRAIEGTNLMNEGHSWIRMIKGKPSMIMMSVTFLNYFFISSINLRLITLS